VIEILKIAHLAVATLAMSVIMVAIAVVVVILAIDMWREFKRGRR